MAAGGSSWQQVVAGSSSWQQFIGLGGGVSGGGCVGGDGILVVLKTGIQKTWKVLHAVYRIYIYVIISYNIYRIEAYYLEIRMHLPNL